MPRTKFAGSTTPIDQKIFLNVREVAKLLSLTPVTVCKLIKSGKLLGAPVGKGYLVPRRHLDAFIEKGIQSQSAKQAA
jgi:excisionase family DNA binding protein